MSENTLRAELIKSAKSISFSSITLVGMSLSWHALDAFSDLISFNTLSLSVG